MSEENKKKNDWKEREVGALWKKEGQNQVFYSGKIKLAAFPEGSKEIKIVGFRNKGKAEYPNSPDVILYESKPPKGQEDSPQKPQPETGVDEDLPF